MNRLMKMCQGKALLLLLVAGGAVLAGQSTTIPRFEDYPAKELFTGAIASPKLVTALERSYSQQIQDGVQEGYGVFRDEKEQRGPNFAGHLIVIQWACGAPCIRMAIVDARTGDVHYPPISFGGVGVESFDLPLLAMRNTVPQNPEVRFRPNSNLMIIMATPDQSAGLPSYTYYFLWNENRWTLLQKTPLT